MEEGIAEENGGFSSNSATNDDSETLSTVFYQLKPYCLDLLELLQNPNKNGSTISELYEVLRSTPPNALQHFLDYTLFPLLLLLDAAVSCRSPQKVDPKGKFQTLNSPNTPYAISDSMAEGVLLCLEELLKKCQLGSVNQMVVVLKKLTYGLLLSPSDAAEEFRERIIRCFRALLLGLHPCSDECCVCRKIPGLPTFISCSTLQILPINQSQYKSEVNECLLAFLQSQSASAAVGHWLSLLLKTADIEAARGHRGSAKIRIEAFLTLRVLVSKVGTADALAFFLPGVVSQIAKVLHASRTMISGAAGSTDAITQAIRALVEFLMIVLEDGSNFSSLDMSVDYITGLHPNQDKSPQSFLEALRHLPVNAQEQGETLVGDSNVHGLSSATPNFELKGKNNTNSRDNVGYLYVNRTEDWIEETSAHVNKLLSATFPHLIVHPAKKVRQCLVDAVRGLLSRCGNTMKKSRLMLLECLCVLVCDDSEEVSVAAQEFLESFFMLGEKHFMEVEVAEIFNRLIERLPKVVLGSEEIIALSHAQRLLAVIYYAGPQLVVDHLLRSPITAARFLDVLTLCLSQNSVFAGALDKFILAKTFSAGYLHSIAELKAGPRLNCADLSIVNAAPSEVTKTPGFKDTHLQNPVEIVHKKFEGPHMPPWFSYVGSQKLYQALAGILRLVGLSTMADSRSEVPLSTIIDIPLNYLRKLISEVRMKTYSKESWQSWYTRTGSGQLLRQASTAACILNEIIYGISDKSIDAYARKFRKSQMNGEDIQGYNAGSADARSCKIQSAVLSQSVWNVCQGKDARGHLIDCIGSILHEYLSPEVWDLPIDQKASLLEQYGESEDITLHFFRDTEMLHQVLIDGIGVFNACLGKDFASSGFLHSSLYLLLENLICSSYQIRSASDAVLHVISISSGYRTVGSLVVANADYIIDSLCRQLRHLDINPHVPNVLASMLSYIGVANEILPFLEEPMRSVSLELEVLGRHQHPDLTIPFLKAVAEIAKASKREACAMPSLAESYYLSVKSKVSHMEKKARKESRQHFVSHEIDDVDVGSTESVVDVETNGNDVDMLLEHWEEMLFKLNESKRYRRTVGSVAGSCLTSAMPLLASAEEAACLVALDIVEDGIATLAKVEEAYKHERETKESIKQAIQLCSFHYLQDTLDAADEGTDENRLLPAMNKIWPYLVVCIKNKNSVAIRRCLGVVSSVVQICGGDFFSRRFHKDGSHFWKLLTTSPFWKKPIPRDEKMPLQLPYRSSSTSSENSMAETSNLKVQAAALNMIADLSMNKKSASALEAVLKKVSGLVVGIACSGVVGLCDASINALSGLACIDPDLIWLLVADLYYSLKKDVPSPTTLDLPHISQLLPSPVSPKEYLYVQYGGESFGFGADLPSVEIVFKKLHSEVFTLQTYS